MYEVQGTLTCPPTPPRATPPHPTPPHPTIAIFKNVRFTGTVFGPQAKTCNNTLRFLSTQFSDKPKWFCAAQWIDSPFLWPWLIWWVKNQRPQRGLSPDTIIRKCGWNWLPGSVKLWFIPIHILPQRSKQWAQDSTNSKHPWYEQFFVVNRMHIFTWLSK